MSNNEPVFRVDRFKVPTQAKNELLNAIRQMHKFLRTLPGYLMDEILIESTETESINIITILEWLNNKSAKNASKSVREMQQKENFNPQDIIKRNNIKSEIFYLKKVKF